MSDLHDKLSPIFSQAAPKDGVTAFAYGECKVTVKNSKEINRFYRDIDFINDEPYASSVAAMLARLGLPQPQAEDIFRGTEHDILFLNSHGVVVRIGPTDVVDLMNPTIVQPLGWVEDPAIMITQNSYDRGMMQVPLSVTVHPGIELHSRHEVSEEYVRFRKMLVNSAQKDGDAGLTNAGLIRLLNDGGELENAVVLLDADNKRNYSFPELAQRREMIMEELEGKFDNKADYLSAVLQATFTAPELKPWLRAFDTHQVLRHMFWEAFKDPANPDVQKRTAFWEACARVTNNPHQAMMHVWRAVPGLNGKPVFQRTQACMPYVVALYRPWTGTDADRNAACCVDPAVKQALLAAVRVKPVLPIGPGAD